eukprot:m.61779 g.61779  ORF g.61779 m.61779 type:complete len:104 (+) comp7367_c0_seq2:992-1303(+)
MRSGPVVLGLRALAPNKFCSPATKNLDLKLMDLPVPAKLSCRLRLVRSNRKISECFEVDGTRLKSKKFPFFVSYTRIPLSSVSLSSVSCLALRHRFSSRLLFP